MTSTSLPQATVRSIITGMIIGAILTPCNVYSGLKIGWSFNMSIAAALISFAFWKIGEQLWGARPWGMLENNINQTAASSSASIISAGLVAPIPALTMLTGRSLTYPLLVGWVFVVSFLGVIVAVGLRRQMLVRDQLPFPAGIATAETMREIYAHGREALRRVQVLLSAGILSAGLKLVNDFVVAIPRLKLPFSLTAGGSLQAKGIASVSSANLGFVLDPSLLMIGFGAIIGLRTGVSLLLGAIAAWGILGPWALAQGWASAGNPGPDAFWFGAMVKWLLWPGVTMMVVAALTSFALMLRRALHTRRGRESNAGDRPRSEQPHAQVTLRWFAIGLAAATLLGVIGQYTLFDIDPVTGAIAVALSFLLAVVAARVSGETGITPIGAMGKITQLSFAVISPANVTSNLMSANVTGGAAGQCADLMHDFKTGLLLGAEPRFQALAQVFGVLTGSLVGAATYIVLVPDPSAMLITPEWPAPAVATWKAVAEVLQGGLDNLPHAAAPAMAIAGGVGLVLALAQHLGSSRWSRLVPSASAVGLAFVIPAWNSMSMFIGALLAYAITRLSASWAERFLIAAAAGLVAGESLAGVASAMSRLLFS
ncbi:MAG: OPT/YSL family transporter [Gammaproteobacteria bacterium]